MGEGNSEFVCMGEETIEPSAFFGSKAILSTRLRAWVLIHAPNTKHWTRRVAKVGWLVAPEKVF